MGRVSREKRQCDHCGKFKFTTAVHKDKKSAGPINAEIKPSISKSKTQSHYGKRSLENIGFQKAGVWAWDGNQLSFKLIDCGDFKPALYAFTSKEDIFYLGKTSRKLARRLYHYSKPGRSQSTNIRVNALIRKALAKDMVIEILAFGDQEEARIGDFVMDIPASLENDIIRKVQPKWNMRKS